MKNKRVIVIAGCTRGIGRALVEQFHKLGHTVGGCGRDGSAIEELRTKIGSPSHFRKVDICDGRAVASWASEAMITLGAPDLLICNAGVINATAPFWRIPKAEFDHVIDVNVKGTANVLRSFVPAIVAHRRGVIVNISSGCGLRGYPDVSAYCASKFAIEGLSKAIAAELPPEIACIPVSPGVINTDMLRCYWGESRAAECDSPEKWAIYAAPWLLALGTKENGQSVRVSS